MGRLALLAFVVLAWLPITPASAQDISLRISRNTEVTTLYVSAPADVIDAVGPSQIADFLPDDTLSTYAHGQLAATSHMARVETAFSLSAADVEPIAMHAGTALLHVARDPLPFDTPMAASLATSVCATPRDALPSLEELRIYTSFAANVSLDTALSHVALPLVFASVGDLNVRVFQGGALIMDTVATPDANGLVSISPPPISSDQRRLGLTLFLAGIALVFLAGSGAVLGLWRTQSDENQHA